MELAIKGHEKRGDEVIALLEMLGGRNPHNYSADCDSLCFYISTGTNIICYDWVNNCYEDEDVLILSLEEFEDQFPYKVGDKVLINGDVTDVYTITSMTWGGLRVVYKIRAFDDIDNVHDWFADEMKPYKEETMNRKYNVEEYLKVWDAAEKGLEVFVNDNFELKEDNGKFYIVKKQPQYPKTYKECCGVLRIPKNEHYIDIDAPLVPSDYNRLVSAFTKLLICRDTYWKIAGDWEPDWTNKNQCKFVISTINKKIEFNEYYFEQKILAFPTEEMRDVFFDNFKELIEIVKELL